ncbi:transcriptional regulator Myc-B-like [Brachyistius frenatus]|uniref:transcriptional regulator Myc-B-like n=1 Tax=Brachyistius frenatus TaxID=100188 RepID=UPI0037E98E77
MPPVLTSTNYDYDYDTVQPYFFLDGEEEDFYPPRRSQLLPGPGEDIWKKFELLPTPPLSPRRSPGLSDADHLEAVSSLLDEDCNPSAAFLQSFIIQDCMWSSSFDAGKKLDKVVSERLASLRARRDSADDIAHRAADQQVGGAHVGGAHVGGAHVGGAQVSAEYLQDLHAAATDCISPSAVFPCAAATEVVSSAPCLDSPPFSGSDSESEEEDEEEEEEEEIDVVTVDRQKSSRRSDASPVVLKRSHVDIHQHNYAAQRPAGKRAKLESGCPSPRRSGGRRCWSPRPDGADGADDNKRRTHNVLERQRRNELKRSFLALRDEVPAVADNDKAAKVAILRKATEFVREVGEDERRLLRTKEELRKRSRELKRRLEKLRTL